MAFAKLSVVIPTYKRLEKLRISLQRILACEPSPGEVIVHVDAGDTETGRYVRSSFPEVRCIESADRVGPGGGRNRLIAQASYPLVASFDDDSYPVDVDYFFRVERMFNEFPQAAVLAAVIFHEGEEVMPDDRSCLWVADFVGCGCAYRREAFLQTAGFVPLRLAYGMEEVDLALRLHGSGWGILHSRWLRVLHNTNRQQQSLPTVTAATIANIFLLAYLRYPLSQWGIGIVQAINRVWWLLWHNRWGGILAGFAQIPSLIRSYSGYRGTVPVSVLNSYLRLRKEPLNAGTIGTHIEVPHSSRAFQ